ncbi:9961_t:CDS:2 [Entrophospora sp. SA101]|nr:9961_t:CDS:2 [Entrophospora sp. SA101]
MVYIFKIGIANGHLVCQKIKDLKYIRHVFIFIRSGSEWPYEHTNNKQSLSLCG